MGYYSNIEGMFTIETKDGSPIDPFVFAYIVKGSGSYEYLIYNPLDCIPHHNYSPTATFSVYGNGKYYDLDDDTDEFAAALNKAGLELSGHLYRVGEEQPDVEKIVVDKNIVTFYAGHIAFDDGTKWDR